MSAKNVGTAGHQRAFGPDLIRATAIVLVMLAHTFPGGQKFPILGAVRDYWGVWGVEIFFVLSGYLIGGILFEEFYNDRLRGLGGVLSFWKRRWFRTLPNYYLFLALFLGIDLIDNGRFPDGFIKYLWFGQALWWQHPVFFLMVWSLAIEEWFYLLFPLTLLFLSKITVNRERAIIATLAAFLILPPILRYFVHDWFWLAGVRMMTFPRLDAIAYGACLAFLKRRYSLTWTGLMKCWPIGVAASLALFGYACWYTLAHGGLDVNQAIYRVFYFCFISMGLLLLFPRIAVLHPQPAWWTVIVRKLSLWSYSMYLSHLFCFWIIGKSFVVFGAKIHGGSWTQVAGDVMDWVMTLAFSAALYRYFEKPCMDLRDRKKAISPAA